MADKPIPRLNNGRKELPIAFICVALAYCPDTGKFTWKDRPDIPPKAYRRRGKPAGTRNKDGHVVIEIAGFKYPAHRIAWATVTGVWPIKDIDHINGDRADNRWSNLREATRQENLRNMKRRPNNKSGFKWVSWCKATNSWKAQIRMLGTNRHIGCFKTPEEAHKAACEAAKKHHKEFARFE